MVDSKHLAAGMLSEGGLHSSAGDQVKMTGGLTGAGTTQLRSACHGYVSVMLLLHLL